MCSAMASPGCLGIAGMPLPLPFSQQTCGLPSGNITQLLPIFPIQLKETERQEQKWQHDTYIDQQSEEKGGKICCYCSENAKQSMCKYSWWCRLLQFSSEKSWFYVTFRVQSAHWFSVIMYMWILVEVGMWSESMEVCGDELQSFVYVRQK